MSRQILVDTKRAIGLIPEKGDGVLGVWLQAAAQNGYTVARLSQHGCYVPDRTDEDRPWWRDHSDKACSIGFEPVPRYQPTMILIGRLQRAGYRVRVTIAWVTKHKVIITGDTYKRYKTGEEQLHVLDISWPVRRCLDAGWLSLVNNR